MLELSPLMAFTSLMLRKTCLAFATSGIASLLRSSENRFSTANVNSWSGTTS
jgi:hypothetical protein